MEGGSLAGEWASALRASQVDVQIRDTGEMPRNSSPAAAQIGGNIANARKALSMTVDELAVASRIDSSNVRSYEAGRAMMNVRSLVRIAEALSVEPGVLLEGVASEMFAASN